MYSISTKLAHRTPQVRPPKWSETTLNTLVPCIQYMYVCMYVCVYVCMYARMHACMYYTLSLSLSLSLYIYIYI